MLLINNVLFIYIQYTEKQRWFGSGNKYEDKTNEYWHHIKEIGGKKKAKNVSPNLWHTSFVYSE